MKVIQPKEIFYVCDICGAKYKGHLKCKIRKIKIRTSNY